MQLHEIRPTKLNKGKKRIGRGGKRGTYSGRGQKGQKSRAGRNIKPAQREILLRIPKKRGYKNKPKSERFVAVQLGLLNKIEGNVVNLEKLVQARIITKSEKIVKIVNGGQIDTAKEIIGIACTKTAKDAIVKAGGKVS